MLFIVRFTDHPERLPLRKELLPSHLQWLEEHQSVVLVAGSVRPEQEAAPAGAVWIVEAPGKAEVEALLQTDPFWVKGLRQSFEVLFWSKAFPERKVPV
jgi:uncharacterized protein YciI